MKMHTAFPPLAGSCNSVENVPTKAPTFSQQFRHDIKGIFSKEGRRFNGRDWRLIFAQSYFCNAISPHMLLAWRIFVFFFFWGTFVSDMLVAIPQGNAWYVAFLTNLGFLMNVLSVTLVLILSLLPLVEWRYPAQHWQMKADLASGYSSHETTASVSKPSFANLPGYKELFLSQPNKISTQYVVRPSRVPKGFIDTVWVFNSVSMFLVLTVDLLYWALLVPLTNTSPRVYQDYFKHLINFPLLFISLIISNIPYPLFHGVFNFLAAVIYAAISLIVFIFRITIDGNVGFVYSILNFNASPVTASLLLLVNVFIFVPLITFLIYIAVGWRICRNVNPARCCCPSTSTTGIEMRGVADVL